MDPVEVGLYSVVDLTKKRRNKLKSECKGDILPFPASVEDIDKKSAHTAGRIPGYGSQGQPTNAAKPPSPIYAVVDLSKKQRKSIKSERVAVDIHCNTQGNFRGKQWCSLLYFIPFKIPSLRGIWFKKKKKGGGCF